MASRKKGSSKKKSDQGTASLKSGGTTTTGLKSGSSKKPRKNTLGGGAGGGGRDRTKSYGGNIYDVYEAKTSATTSKDYLANASYASAGHAAQTVVVYDRNGRRIEFDWDRKYWEFKRKFKYGQALELLKKRIKELEPLVKRAIENKDDELLEEYELEAQVIYDRLADLRVVSPSREIPVVKKRAKNLLDSIKQARAELMHGLEEEERRKLEAERRRKEDALRENVEELERQVDQAINNRDVPSMNKLQNVNIPDMVNRLKQFAAQNGDSTNIQNMIDDCDRMDERLTQAIQQCKEEDVLAEELEHLKADSENAIAKGDVKRMGKCESNCENLLDRLQKRQPRSEKVNEMIEECKDIQTKLNNGKVLEKLKKMCENAIKSGDLTQMKKCKSEIEARSTGGNADVNDIFYPLKQQIDSAINKTLKGIETKCDELKDEIDKTVDDSIGGANSRFDPSVHDGYALDWNKKKISDMKKFKNTEIVPLYDEVVKQKDLSHNYDQEHPRSNFDNFEQQELAMANKLADIDQSVYNYIRVLEDANTKIESDEKAIAKKKKQLKKSYDEAMASKDPGRMEMIQNEIMAVIDQYEPLRKTSPKIEDCLNKMGEWSDKLDASIEKEKIRIAKEQQDEAERKRIEAEEAKLQERLKDLTNAANDAIKSGDLPAMKKAAKDLADFADELKARNPITPAVNKMLKDLNNVAKDLDDAIKLKEKENELLKDVGDIENDVNDALKSKDIPRIKKIDNRVRQLYNKWKDEPKKTPEMVDALNNLADMSKKLQNRVKELEDEEANLKAKEQEFETLLNQLVDDSEAARNEYPRDIDKMKKLQKEIDDAVNKWEPIGEDLNSKKISRGIRDLKKESGKLADAIKEAEAEKKEEDAFTEAVKNLTDAAEDAIESKDVGDMKDVASKMKILIDEWRPKQPKSEQVKKNLKDLNDALRDLDAAMKKETAAANDFTRRVNELKDEVDAALAADPRKINVMENLNDQIKDLAKEWQPKADACTDPEMRKLLDNNLRTLDNLGNLLDDAIDEAKQREKEEKELTDLVNDYRERVDDAESKRDIPEMERLEKDLNKLKNQWKDKKGESDVFDKNLGDIDDMLDSLGYNKKLFKDEDEFTKQLKQLKDDAKDAKKSGDLKDINKAKQKAQHLLDEWEPKKDESQVIADGINDIYDILIDLNAEIDSIQKADAEAKEAQAKKQAAIDELTKQVAALKPQVNDAIEKRDMNNMTKLKDKDIEPLLAKWQSRKGEDPAIRRAVDDLENMLEALQGCIDDEKSAEDDLIARVAKLEDAVKDATAADPVNIKDLQQLKQECEDLVGIWEPKCDTSNAVGKPVSTLKKLAKKLDRAIEDWKNNVKDFSDKVKELEKGVKAGRKQYNRAKLQRLDKDIDDLVDEWKPKKDDLGADAKKTVEDGLDQCDGLKDKIRRTLREMDQLEEEVAQLKSRGKDAMHSSNDSGNASDETDRLNALIDEIDDLLNKWEGKAKDSEWVQSMCNELNDLKKKLERTVEQKEKKKKEQEAEFAKNLEILKKDVERAIEKDNKRGEVKFMPQAQDDVDAFISDIKAAMRESGDKGATLRPLFDAAEELSKTLEKAIDQLRDRIEEENKFDKLTNELLDDADDAMDRRNLDQMKNVEKDIGNVINEWKDKPSMKQSRKMQKNLKKLEEKQKELARAIDDEERARAEEEEEKKREAAERARKQQELDDLKRKVNDLEKEVDQAIIDEDVQHMQDLQNEIDNLINKYKDTDGAKPSIRKLKNMQARLDDKLKELEDARKRRESVENDFDAFVKQYNTDVNEALKTNNPRKMKNLLRDGDNWDKTIKDLQGNYVFPEQTKKNLKKLHKLQGKLSDRLQALKDMDEDLGHLQNVCKELKGETRKAIKGNDEREMGDKKEEIDDLIKQWTEWAQDPPVPNYRVDDINSSIKMLQDMSDDLKDALDQKKKDEEEAERLRALEEEKRREQDKVDKEIRKLEKQTRDLENRDRDLRRRDIDGAQRLKDDVDDLLSKWKDKIKDEPDKYDVPRVRDCIERLEDLSKDLGKNIKKWENQKRMKEEERRAKQEKLAREQDDYKSVSPRVKKEDKPFDIIEFLDDLEPKVAVWEKSKHKKYEWLDEAIKADKILQDSWEKRRDYKDVLKKAYGSPYTKLQTLKSRVSALVKSKVANFTIAFEIKKDSQGRMWFNLKELVGQSCEDFRSELENLLRKEWKSVLDTMDPVEKLVSNIKTQASSGKLNIQMLALDVDNEQRTALLEKIHAESDTDVNGNVIHRMSQLVKDALESQVPEGINKACDFNGYFEVHMNTAEASF